MRSPIYPAYEYLAAAGRARPELWRLVLGLGLAFVAMFMLMRGASNLLDLVLGTEGAQALSRDVETGETPRGVLTLLALMGTMGAGTVIAALVVHGRGLISLIGPPGLALYQFWRVARALILMQAVLVIATPWDWAIMLDGLTPRLWISLLPLTVLALLVQTGSEELLFRGYFQSQLAARGLPVWLWLTLPSALFALAHFDTAMFGSAAWAIVIWAFVFGVVAADLTARSGTLGPAIALHLVNNFVAISIVSLDGALSGLALYRLPVPMDDLKELQPYLAFDLAVLGLAWLCARLALRR